MKGKNGVGYIRHTFHGHIGSAAIRKLQKNGLIAVHYKNIPSIEPKDYPKKSAKSSLKRLKGWCDQGKIVIADYGAFGIWVGKIRPGSKVFAKDIKDRTYTEQTGKKKVIFKAVKLIGMRQARGNGALLLKAVQPRMCTINESLKGADCASAILAGKSSLGRNVKSLSPEQLEILCYEFLRMKGKIDFLLMPIGRTLKDIDIYGMKGSKGVVAQVTQSSKEKDIQEKLKRLYSGEYKKYYKIFFAPFNPSGLSRQVIFFNINDVFTQMQKSSTHKQMVIQMLKMR